MVKPETILARRKGAFPLCFLFKSTSSQRDGKRNNQFYFFDLLFVFIDSYLIIYLTYNMSINQWYKNNNTLSIKWRKWKETIKIHLKKIKSNQKEVVCLYKAFHVPKISFSFFVHISRKNQQQKDIQHNIYYLSAFYTSKCSCCYIQCITTRRKTKFILTNKY